MDRDRVLHPPGVSSGIGHHDGNISGLRDAKELQVPFFQTFNRQCQATQLVLFVRIGPGDVAQQLRLELSQPRTERLVQPGEILLVGGPVGQIYID